MQYKLLLFAILIQIPSVAISQSSGGDSIHPPYIFQTGLGFHYGFIFAHNKLVQNTKGSNPRGIEADLSRRLINNKSWNDCRCYPRNGLVISYFDFDTRVLGKAISAGAYIEPFFFPHHRINLSLKGVAGLSYLTNPYHKTRNPDNNSYSTHLSAYLALGIGFNVIINHHLSAKLSGFYNHNSNGAIKEPNSGINWPAATVHVYYAFNPVPLPVLKKSPFSFYWKKPVRTEIYLLATQRFISKEAQAHYIIIGVGFKTGKQISGINAIHAGVEVVADYAVRKQLEQEHTENGSYIQPGILIGHEFLMGKFTFSQQLGIYVVNRVPFYDPVYQRYGLNYQLSNHWALGIHVKAHRQIAAFLDGRITFTFPNLKKDKK